MIFNFCEQKTLSTQDRADLAVSLCHITEYLGLAPYFITKLITKEIKKTDKKVICFFSIFGFRSFVLIPILGSSFPRKFSGHKNVRLLYENGW